MNLYYTLFKTEIDEITLVGDESGLQILHVDTGAAQRHPVINKDWIRDDDFFKEIVSQINEYLEGRRTRFELKLNPQGTDFQKKVWKSLQTISYGETRSYGEIAAAIGNPNASRAVGMANRKNPLPLIVPCHRVIGASGKLTGYAYGLELKQKLLDLEKN